MSITIYRSGVITDITINLHVFFSGKTIGYLLEMLIKFITKEPTNSRIRFNSDLSILLIMKNY